VVPRRIRAALVSDIAGTTRDFLVGETMVDGQRCLVVDTAGVERGRIGNGDLESGDVESSGVITHGESAEKASPQSPPPAPQQAAEAAAQALGDAQRDAATVTLLCIDTTRALTKWESQQLATPTPGRLTVLTKADQLAT